MRHNLKRFTRSPADILEMLFVRCSSSSTSSGGAARDGFPGPGRPRPSTGASPRQSPDTHLGPRGVPNGAQPQQQHHEYHRISTEWQVPRTALKHYPEQAQTTILNNLGRPKKQAAASASSAAAAGLRTGLAASLDTVLQAVRYETQQGYNNFLGRSGDRFADWAVAQLTSTSAELSASGHSDLAHRSTSLAHQFSGYTNLLGPTERESVLSHAAEEVLDILHLLSESSHLHPSRSERYAPIAAATTATAPSYQPPSTHNTSSSSNITNTSNNTNSNSLLESAMAMDEVAAAAHAEDTIDVVGESPISEIPADDTPLPIIGVPSPDGSHPTSDEYIQLNGRRVKSSTAAFRRSFAEAALQAAYSDTPGLAELESGEQRTKQWMSLRERRLTASAFSKALGFFSGDRVGLWEEKIGIREPFKGNEATQWGTKSEAHALSTYERLTGHQVEGCMFRVKHDDAPHGWLGASPDGLIGSLTVQQGPPGGTVGGVGEMATAAQTLGGGGGGGEVPAGPGILEIKCPFNKGRPDLAAPPDRAIWYYMPQLQGLMDVFDREWCTLFIWTPQRGSASFLVRRNRDYWAACFDVLAEFWWAHVVPARQARERGASLEEIEAFRPSELHQASEELKVWSKRLASEAPSTRFAPLSPSSQIRQ